MSLKSSCPQCQAVNRRGLFYCVACGESLPRAELPPDRITAVAWPGPEILRAAPLVRPSAFAVAALIAALLAWSVLPLLGAGLAVVLALRAEEHVRVARGALAGRLLIRVALWLGGGQLALALIAGVAAMAAAVVSAFVHGG
ncbi:MAG TPA: zinc ribbon domain-containing protein [Myxococcaceae bacterium]|nr:zinc ribbon domain-containing protein [Myxococcaceae bacterium]